MKHVLLPRTIVGFILSAQEVLRRSQPPHASDILTSLYLHFMSTCLHISLSPHLYHNALGFSSTSFTPVSSTNLSFPTSIISASFRTLSCTVLFIMPSYPCIFPFAQGRIACSKRLNFKALCCHPLLLTSPSTIHFTEKLSQQNGQRYPNTRQARFSLASIRSAKSMTRSSMKIATNCIIKNPNLPSSFLQTRSETVECSTPPMKNETKSCAYFDANEPFGRWSRSLETNNE